MLTGRLVAADRFGNVVTLDRSRPPSMPSRAGARLACASPGGRLRLVGTYAEIGDGEVAALFGSTGLLELAARSAPALGRDGVAIGGADRWWTLSLP